MARVFISYKRDVTPDQDLSNALYRALQASHEVFIDTSMVVGERWAERIGAEIRQADFFITLLSPFSVNSEMARMEIELAHQQHAQYGKPVLLPIRVAYHERLPSPLSSYLGPINWALWEGPEDTPRLLEQLARAMSGSALPESALPATKPASRDVPPAEPASPPLRPPLPSAPLELDEPLEGAMDTQSAFYVVRGADATVMKAVAHKQGATITIKGARQMGKSSLLMRGMAGALTAGKRVAYLSLQEFDSSSLRNPDLFFQRFCSSLGEQLGLTDQVEAYWQKPMGSSQRCGLYMSGHILRSLDAPLVLGLDEVETLFEIPFGTDFFGMLRSWHNNRALPTTPVWKKLSIVLVTSTEPFLFIKNMTQSPFNVGQTVELDDFAAAQVVDLNQRHGSPLSAQQAQELFTLLGGHPYLVRKALYLVASGSLGVAELFSQVAEDRGPFGDHLRNLLFRLSSQSQLKAGLREVLQRGACTSEDVFIRLRSAGLVRQEGTAVLPRCELYRRYFRERLLVA
ncbi:MULTISPECIES: AAA-like domain-containing protein [unclassified Corallococcus]|uniref:AAA-like domain-containing protein n=1 Tax=unclassified Corallococcus TaxID=2685029 RepID=UPI001A8F75FE|nr:MULTISPECIES: AAA-like domain-containing protein [unclassified Corallococcus]MBN9684340.1 AAA-like domain-containing protein [Corallococcus sp. NCSPR001]WAS84181.1 AAA-like domain-containing protein [Corallococcus sp. NCRR]